MLSRDDAAGSHRLKKEFRALSDLVHPNLIRLYELFVGELDALVDDTLGLWLEAGQHFDHALRRNTAVGARPLVALTQAGLARMLLRRRRAGDETQARALLAEAFDLARELGMVPLQRTALSCSSLGAISLHNVTSASSS